MNFSFSHTASALYDAALALLYPQACAVCGASVEARDDGVVCGMCWRATRVLTGALTMCWKCGVLSPEARVPEEVREGVRCRRCEGEAFDAARACGVYEKALRASVLRLKQEPFVAPRLLRLMLATQRAAPLCDATRVVPVPLHPARQRERGFNQASVLASAVARMARLPFDDLSLVRALHTERHRAGMDARARRESVADAFCVMRPRLIEGERILLVDDVYTTGATVSACAQALKDAGAAAVYVLTVARPLT